MSRHRIPKCTFLPFPFNHFLDSCIPFTTVPVHTNLLSTPSTLLQITQNPVPHITLTFLGHLPKWHSRPQVVSNAKKECQRKMCCRLQPSSIGACCYASTVLGSSDIDEFRLQRRRCHSRSPFIHPARSTPPHRPQLNLWEATPMPSPYKAKNSLYSSSRDCARFPAIIVTCRESSLTGWYSHTEPSVRHPITQSLRGKSSVIWMWMVTLQGSILYKKVHGRSVLEHISVSQNCLL
jgi:hypothetical protein